MAPRRLLPGRTGREFRAAVGSGVVGAPGFAARAHPERCCTHCPRSSRRRRRAAVGEPARSSSTAARSTIPTRRSIFLRRLCTSVSCPAQLRASAIAGDKEHGAGTIDKVLRVAAIPGSAMPAPLHRSASDSRPRRPQVNGRHWATRGCPHSPLSRVRARRPRQADPPGRSGPIRHGRHRSTPLSKAKLTVSGVFHVAGPPGQGR